MRHHAGERVAKHDLVAEEVPVALVVNGISYAVMMASPVDLEEFAVGFALTEGVVLSLAQIYGVEVRRHAHAFEAELTVAQEAFQRMKAHRRILAGRTGCGVCGIESLELLDLTPERLVVSLLPHDLHTAIGRAVRELPGHQLLSGLTGGLHAAAWCSLDGTILAAFEDVGRHNALDKLIGYLVRRHADLRAGFVFMSSRASYELVRKAARVGVSMLATISAPTSLAIDIAGEAGLKLVSFCRETGFVEYT